MAEENRLVELTPFEYRLMIRGLSDFRNDLIQDRKPTEDVNGLLLKVIDAPKRKHFGRKEHEGR
jgi:hypothetical protein